MIHDIKSCHFIS
ncbi:acyl transferase domain protein, partial [Yersinia pestis PY-19]